MNWTTIESADQIEAIKEQQDYSLIFKHSTRCSISMMVKRRFELDWDKLPGNLPPGYFQSNSNRLPGPPRVSAIITY
jgi:bacillithiol system protein YtxJ